MKYHSEKDILHILDLVMSDDSIRRKGNTIRKRLKELPGADVVEVVRCKECQFCINHPTSDKAKLCTNEEWNTEYYPLVLNESFCSYGKRKEGAEKQ